MQTTSRAEGGRPGATLNVTLNLTNKGANMDAYALSATLVAPAPVGKRAQRPLAVTTSFWDEAGAVELTTTPMLMPGASMRVNVKIGIPAEAQSGERAQLKFAVASTSAPALSREASLKVTSTSNAVLFVDGDNEAPDVAPIYKAALDAVGYPYDTWDLNIDPDLSASYLKSHSVVVWATGASFPGPITPYEPQLTDFLNDGGNLFLSGWDILNGYGGDTPFVRNYLHVDWDDAGSDQRTDFVHPVPTNTVTGGLGTYPLDTTIFGGVHYEDRIVPIAPAGPAFRDDDGYDDALTVQAVATPTGNSYKTMFLAFPFEAMGADDDRVALLNAAFNWFGLNAPTTLDVSLAWDVIVANGFDATVLQAKVLDAGGKPIYNHPMMYTSGRYVAALRGDNQVPPVTTSASGAFASLFDPATGRLDYSLVVTDIANVTAAHIHRGAANANGGVMVNLIPSGATLGPGSSVTGSITITDPADVALLMADQTYVNVHTTANPAGEIRGQVMDGRFNASLASANEVATPTEVTWGNAMFTYDPFARALYYRVDVGSGTTASALHIHEGAAGVNGPVVFPLALPLGPGVSSLGTLALTQAQEVALLTGQYYVNVHTAADPGGSMRGQINVPQASFTGPDGVAFMPVANLSPGQLKVWAKGQPNLLGSATVNFHAVTDATRYYYHPYTPPNPNRRK